MSFHKSFADAVGIDSIHADIQIYSTVKLGGANVAPPIKLADGTIYSVFITNTQVLVFAKSIDGGITWTNPVTINAATSNHMPAVWFDKWSGLSTGLIHVAYVNTVGHDTLYRTIDTASADALSTETTIFDGVSATTIAGGNSLTITRSRGGNVYCRTCIDNGSEGVFSRLSNADVPNGAWSARTINTAIATAQQCLLSPGWAADNNDIIAIFWLGGATDTISRHVYDDSANSWATTSISTGMADLIPSATNGFPNFAIATDLTNSQTVLIAWNGADTANADLKCWTITESAITAKTDVVTNGTDDQGLCALAIATDTGYWYAFYCGKSDGSETWNTNINIYMKISTDAGTTWGSETLVTNTGYTWSVVSIFAWMHFVGDWSVQWIHDHALVDRLMITIPLDVGA